MSIESKHVGTVEGFEIDARLVPDDDTRPEEFDCYSEDDKAAWRRDDWSYVGTIITASKEGIELGESALWGSEYGYLPGVEGSVSPLDGDGDDFVNGYGRGMISEAIAEAKATLARLTEV